MKQVPCPKSKIGAKTPTTSDVFILWRSLKLGIANSSFFWCVDDRTTAQLSILLAIVPWILKRTPPRWLCFTSLKHTVIQLRHGFNFSIPSQRIILSEKSNYETTPVVYIAELKRNVKGFMELILQCLWKGYKCWVLFNEDSVIFGSRRRGTGLGHWLKFNVIWMIFKQVSNQIPLLTCR